MLVYDCNKYLIYKICTVVKNKKINKKMNTLKVFE